MAVMVSTPDPLRFVLAVWRRSWRRSPEIPALQQAAAKAVLGFLHGFPLYRKTRLVSRRRCFHNSENAACTSGVMGITRVSPFLVLRSVNSLRLMSTSGHSSLSNSSLLGHNGGSIDRTREADQLFKFRRERIWPERKDKNDSPVDAIVSDRLRYDCNAFILSIDRAPPN